MTWFRRPPSKTFLLLVLGLALALVATLFRLAFLKHFDSLARISTPDARRALYLGLKFDLRWVAILLAPAWLLLKQGRVGGETGWRATLAPWFLMATLITYGVLVIVGMVDDRAGRKLLVGFFLLAGAYRFTFRAHGLNTRNARWIWLGYAASVLLFTFLGYFVDVAAYAYIKTRLNGTLLMFMGNPIISLGMVWESYPVLRLVLLLAALTGGSLWGIRWMIARGVAAAPESLKTRVLARSVMSLLLVAGMWGKWSAYPLRWAEAFEARAIFDAHLALNPLIFLLETRREMDEGYDLAKVQATHALMAEHLGAPLALNDKGEPSLRRRIQARPQLQGRPNVVFIQLESLAAYKTSLFGNPLDPTPFLSRLAQEGVLLENFHVVMENTSRSMFATLFGIPDVSTTENATRNPLLVNQHSPLAVLEGYAKEYYLGGSANWAQIRGALKNNLKDLRLHEEGSFQSPVVDVWGISDADLLKEAHADFLAHQGPFMAYVQTSGNHPPFTIPKHHADFTRRVADAGELAEAGFISNEEFNAVRLMDYALETYFNLARQAPYFQNTVFVLWSDHGILRGNTDARYDDLALGNHHVPCILYAPGQLKPQRISTVASQVDLMPTVLSLMGYSHWIQTLGKDVFDPAHATKAAAFTFTTFRRPPRTGLIQQGHYLNLDPDGRARLYDLKDRPEVDLTPKDPERQRRMKALTEAYLVWSHYLLSHNPPIQERP